MKKVMNESGEYRYYEFEIGLPEGGSWLRDGKLLGWREEKEKKWHRIDDYEPSPLIYSIRLIVTSVGFTDHKAPVRNWGIK